MILKPDDLQERERYKVLIGTILPRPIAWVSTMDAAGQLNLAPFSYFTIASTTPMTLLFCPQVPSGTQAKKDTLRNIEEVPEFVVNLTNSDTVEAMNLSATILPPGRSEFEWANVTPIASEHIGVPRVAEAPVAFECSLQRIVTVSDQPGGGSVVFGEVRCIHLHDDLYADGGRINLDKFKPVGRLAGSAYTRVTDTFELERMPPPAD